MVDTRRIPTAIVLAALLSTMPSNAQDIASEDLPSDTAVLTLSLPSDSHVSIDGKQYGDRRSFTFRRLAPDQRYLSRVSVTFAKGKTTEREVLLKGGGRASLALLPPDVVKPEIELQTGHAAAVAAFSPDGRYLLTGADDRTVVLWDVATGRQLRRHKVHLDSAMRIAYDMRLVHFLPDGKSFLSVDDVASVWDLATGKRRRSMHGDLGNLFNAAVSRDGAMLATNGFEKGKRAVYLWDVTEGTRSRTLAEDEDSRASLISLAFRTDGRQLASGYHDHSIWIWNVQAGKVVRKLNHPESTVYGVRSLCYSHDGARLLSAGHEKAVVWNLESGKQLQTFPVNVDLNSGQCIAFSPDGKRVLTASEEHAASIWDAASGERIRTFDEGNSRISLAMFSPDGRFVLTGSSGLLKLWNVESGEFVRQFAGVLGAVHSVRFDARGERVVVGAAKQAVVWDLPAGKPVANLNEDARVAAITPDGRRVLVGNGDGTIFLHDAASGERLAGLHGSGEDGVVFGPEGRLFTAGGNFVEQWQTPAFNKTGGYRHQRLLSETYLSDNGHLAVSTDGRRLLTRTGGFRETKEFTIWDTVTGRRLWSKTLENSEDPRHFATTVFSPDLRYLLLMVSVENNRQATLFDVDRNEKVRDVEFEGTAAYTAVFRSDGKQLLTAHMEIREDSEADDESAKCHVVLWDIANKEALQVLPFHSGVGRISFARDGARFATTAPLVTDQETTGDNMELTMPSRPEEVPESIWRQYEQLLARSRNEELEFQPSILKSVVWDSETGKEVASLLTVGRNVSALTFSPGGDALLTKTVLGEKMESLSSDQVDVWDVASGKRTVSLPRQRFDIAMHQFGPRGGNLLTAGTDFRSTQIILWDLETGERLREFQGPDASSKGVSLSADGRYVAAAYTQSHAQNGGRTIVWDAATGKRVFDLATPTTDVSVLDVRHDGELVLSVHENYQDQPSVISLWSPDGSLIRNLPTDSMMVRSASFSPSGEQVVYSTEQGVFVKSALTDADAATIVSREVKKKKNGKQRKPGWFSASDAHLAVMSPDGRRVLVADEYFAQLRNAASGALVESYYGPQGGAGRQGIQNAVVTPDGEYVLTVGAARDGGAELMLWDGPSGRLLKRLQGHSDMVQCVAISPDGKRAITGGWDAKAILWDIPSGQIIRELSNIEYIVWNVAISPDGKRALTGSGRYEKFGEMILWDLETGRKLRTFKDHKNYVGAVAFTPDGRSVLSGSWDGDAILWDAASGRKSRTFSHADEQQVYSACFTPDGRQLLTGCSLNSAVLWDVATGRRLRTLAGHHEFVWEVDISPDGRYAATASADHTVSLWDLKSGVRLKTYDGLTQWATAAQFTADGKRLLTSSPQAAAHLIDVASFEPVVTFEAHQGRLQCLAFSPQGAEVFTAASDGGIIQWAADTGASLHRFYGHTYQVTSLDASADGRFLISGSQDGTARLWDANSGQEVVRLIQFRGGDDWVALTPEGLFDGSPGGREKVMFRVGGELDVVPVDRFFQDFYYPGLLTAISAGERPLPQVELPTSHPPLVRIASPKAGGDTSERELELIVEATDQGGGLKGPWLTQNGARVLPSASEVRNGEVVRRTFRVALIEGENHFEALAASADGSWESEPVRMHLAYREKTAEAQLYVISVGVSEYSDESLNLQFAAKDAEAFGDLFRRRASRLFGQDRVHVASLTDGRGTKESIRYTFKVAAERAQPQDVMILFLAGHGAMVGQRYYFIPHDFRPKSSQLEDDIREQGIPADELNDLISAVPALKRVVIYDTCQSGGALALRYRARSAFAFRGALERMARATGSFTLAATSASEEAAEIDDLGHGALTYALLAGAGAVDVGPLKKQRLDTGGEVVNVRDWFNYAQDKVPVVTKAFLGQEQFVTSSGSGTSFPLLPSPAPD